ncbi:MAG: hypothetical protein KF693_12170 [Nitrospira sp.]|nr:hypothetical protein [Nitrospira sp.]
MTAALLRLVAVAIVGFSLTVACSPLPSGPPSSVAIEGFRPFPSARTFDKPGQVFRVDSSGNIYSVLTLNVLPSSGREVLPALSSSIELSIRQVLEAVGLPQDRIYALGEAKVSYVQRFYVESVNGTREYLDDTAIDDNLPRTIREQNITIRPTNRYYLIRETIATDNISYGINKASLIDLGIYEGVVGLLKGQSSLRWKVGDALTLSQSFGQPLRIWYKPERIEFEKTYAFGRDQAVNFKLTPAAPGELRLTGEVPTKP